jgi:alkylhydroperoxidase/carboxymuconolactone decarboxylase family protein YurZ
MLPSALERQFDEFYRAAYADGELDGKTKVLIGLAVAMTSGCDP